MTSLRNFADGGKLVGEITVSSRTDGEVAIIEINSPPVNALGNAVRRGIFDNLAEALADEEIEAIVLTGKGGFFSGGADITEFGKPVSDPILSDLIMAIEAAEKPVVAAINGTALGGGLEVALGCHYRLAPRNARLGLPEVKLGLLPGAGGTQRLPRLVGPVAALAPIVSGTPLSGDEAEALGVIDQLTGSDVVKDATEYAREVKDKRPLRRLSEDNSKLKAVDMEAFENEAARLLSRSRGLAGPKACVQSVRNALSMPFAEASAEERTMFKELREGDESKAQRHLFFAERQALKLPGVGREVRPREVNRVAVIGAGTMGGGIAMSLALGGYDVVLIDVNPENLEKGLATIEKNFRRTQARGGLTGAEVDAALARIKGATSLAETADTEMVIEAVFENMNLKKKIFSELDKIVKPGTILATNTSTLNINEIAAVTSRPEDVMGMHFFSPANVMKLLENVRCEKTSPDVLVTANLVGRRAGKIPVTVGVCDGFVGNRMLYARARQVEALLQGGASPARLDAAAKNFGFAMGPCAVGDLSGLDIGYAVRQESRRRSPVADAIAELGRYGQKTGAGYFLYEEGSRTPIPDPFVDDLIAKVAEKEGVERRELSDEEIVERLVFSLINEGARILAEGIAARSSDIDLIYINGYGFPVAKGGPMYFADQVGLAKVAERLDHYAKISGDETLIPATLLKDLASSGGTFGSWSASGGQ